MPYGTPPWENTDMEGQKWRGIDMPTDPHKLGKSIDMRRLRSCMSDMNVRGWAVTPAGHTYVVFHEGQACLEELDGEEVEVRWGQPEPMFAVAISAARNFKKFLAELTRVSARHRAVAEAAKDLDVKGHYGRIRDQAELAYAQSRGTRRDVKAEAVRKEVRDLLHRCRNKNGIGYKELLGLVSAEVDLLLVEDVMES
jgi:hypothetical protein